MKKQISRRLMAFLLLAIMLITTVPVVAHASSTQITGRSTVAQTVYAGPSSSYYTSIGSIGANETVYVLGKEKGLGWYHIQYRAGSKQKSGYVPTNTITSISGGTPGEEEFYGGYAHSNASQKVWSCDDPSLAVSIGSISANEPVTRLYAYGNVMYIEYSTSSGAKRGYVFSPNFSYPVSPTCVARVTASTTLMYGCKSGCTWETAGSVGAGEYVSVLAGSAGRNIVYVEYNSGSGRKRGYMSASNLSMHGGVTVAQLDDMYGYINGSEIGAYPITVTGTAKVYAAPSTSSAAIGSVSNEEVGFDGELTINGNHWTYIIYKTASGKWKSGFID